VGANESQHPKRLHLFHDVSAGLAGGGNLIAGATAATDRADQLAAFDKGKSTGTHDQVGSSVLT